MLTTVELTPRIGSEIKIDRETLLGGSAAAEIRRLLKERGVLVFRRMNLGEEEQRAFTKTLGKLELQNKREYTRISLDVKENPEAPYLADYLRGSFFWHIDGAFMDVPYLGSILSAWRLSATGGQTEFASTYAAYEDLPDTEKEALDKIRVVHSNLNAQRFVTPEPTYEEVMGWRRFEPKSQPLVWTHESGRKSLVLGATASHVEGMQFEEGYALLARLREWATQPQFVYRHEWSEGDLLIWDNTGVMHRAIPYGADSGRMMYRTTLSGEERLA